MRNEYLGPLALLVFLSGYVYLQTHQKIIVSDDLGGKEIEILNEFSLTEILDETGIKHIHQSYDVHPKLFHLNKWFNSLGVSLSTVDYDDDGFVDIFFCNGKVGTTNELYRNLGNGSFKNVTEETGLNFINSKKGVCWKPHFFDYNGDKTKDLLISTNRCLKLFKQKDGKFTDVSKVSGVSKFCIGAMAVNVLDIDNDSSLDIVAAGYASQFDLFNPHTTKVLQNSSSNATNGGKTILLKNNSDGTFSNVFKDSGLKANNGWALAIGIYDLNYDGFSDIWVTSDFGTNRLYMNKGNGTFSKETNRLPHDYARSGMGVEIEDIHFNKKPLVYISQNFNPFDRISGNQLYKFQEDGEIKDLAQESSTNKCGWSWGSKFIDLNNDSSEDLVVANGFISGDPKKQYWYFIAELDSAGGDKLSDAKNWKPLADYTLGGHQKNCLFINSGKDFINTSDKTIFSEKAYDSRGVAKLDYDNDGGLDLVVTNQSKKPFFYKNTQQNKNTWIGFKLRGNDKNYFAVGARIELTLSNFKVFVKQNHDANGYSAQSDDRLHFGLGKYRIRKAMVYWPWGDSQEIKNFTYNSYNQIHYKK